MSTHYRVKHGCSKSLHNAELLSSKRHNDLIKLTTHKNAIIQQNYKFAWQLVCKSSEFMSKECPAYWAYTNTMA